MLRTIRLTLAIVFFAIITLLFLDFSGTLHGYMGWMAKIQFLPALLALNVGVVLLLVVLTLLFGRVYCSVICPLGVFQDVIYNPQIQISAESETKRSIFREKDKTKRSKKESAQHSKSRNKSFVMTSVSAL